ncbi:MAG: apolipoprotein acyltransferase [Cognatishimia sp.]|nr:apolipoprotein acyltransferase [Cognatishimia sp.]
MIVIVLAVIGLLLGFRTASKRGGNRLDKLQYTAGYGIAFTILGVILTIVIERSIT